jgi:hypothetical protein
MSTEDEASLEQRALAAAAEEDRQDKQREAEQLEMIVTSCIRHVDDILGYHIKRQDWHRMQGVGATTTLMGVRISSRDGEKLYVGWPDPGSEPLTMASFGRAVAAAKKEAAMPPLGESWN